MVDRRRSLHVEVIQLTRARFPMTLATEVPYRSEIERMSARRAPLPTYALRSDAAQLYEELFEEISARLADSEAPIRSADAVERAHARANYDDGPPDDEGEGTAGT